MNDLEPWKIWAVTAALVVVILGVGSANSRPCVLTEPAPAPVAAKSTSESMTVAPFQPASEYDAYSSGSAYRSYRPGVYPVSTAASMSLPRTSAITLSADYDHSAELTVSQEIVAPEPTEPVTVADYDLDSIAPSVELDGSFSELTASEVTSDRWVFPRVADLTFQLSGDNTALLVNRALGNATVYFSTTGDHISVVNAGGNDTVGTLVMLNGLNHATLDTIGQSDAPPFDGPTAPTQAATAVTMALAQAQTVDNYQTAANDQDTVAILLREFALAEAAQTEAEVEQQRADLSGRL